MAQPGRSISRSSQLAHTDPQWLTSAARLGDDGDVAPPLYTLAEWLKVALLDPHRGVRADAAGVPRHIHPQWRKGLRLSAASSAPGLRKKANGSLDPARPCVPPNTAHGWRPVSDEDVRMLVKARPGARFEEMWRQFMGPLQDGKAGTHKDGSVGGNDD